MHNRWGNLRDSFRPATGTATLTERQAEILQLVAEGYCNKEIAALMCLSTKTVEKHRQSLMGKLNLHKTAALTRYAVCSGIIEVLRARLATEAKVGPEVDGGKELAWM